MHTFVYVGWKEVVFLWVDFFTIPIDTKIILLKGKGRRSALKKKAVKSLSMTPTPTTSQKIYYKVIYIKIEKYRQEKDSKVLLRLLQI